MAVKRRRKATVKRTTPRRRKTSGRKRTKLTAAHKAAISRGLKRYHRGR